MKEKKFRILWIVPPVLLAALLIWLLAFQGNYRKAEEGQLLNRENQSEGADSSGLSAAPPKALDGVFHINAGQEAENDMAGADGEKKVLSEEDMVGPGDAAGKELSKKQEGTLLFAGDIYLSSHVLNAYDRAGGNSGGISGVLDREIRDTIEAAGIFMANEEFPFSGRGTKASDKQFTFRLPPDRVEVMRQIGPDIVALANNHALDYGPDALLDTCRILDEAGIRHVGAGADQEEAKAPVYLETGGRKIGFLAASRVIPESSWAAGKDRPGMFITYDPSMLIKEIQAVKAQCDFVVVYVHWGIEKATEPKEYQRTLGKQYIDAGADLVVGSHPHVLQGIEYYKGKPIVYSLGNFVFGSSIPKTALLLVTLPETEEASPGLRLIPCASGGGFTRTLEEEKRAAFFEELQKISFGVTIDQEGNVNQSGE